MADKVQEELGERFFSTFHLIFFTNFIADSPNLSWKKRQTFNQQLKFADLLERVFLRLGSAQSDDQLENTVGKFLTPVLLKLASPHEKVKQKVRLWKIPCCLQIDSVLNVECCLLLPICL